MEGEGGEAEVQPVDKTHEIKRISHPSDLEGTLNRFVSVPQHQTYLLSMS
jgi:hypothetical protein